MAFYPGNYTPVRPTSYPGQGAPSAPIGVPNRITTPVGPATAQPTYQTVANGPQATPAFKVADTVTAVQTLLRNQINQPVSAPTAQPTHNPFPTPLGVSPQFTTPTENWYWVFGSGGEGDNLN